MAFAGRDLNQTGGIVAGRDVNMNYVQPAREPVSTLPKDVRRFIGRKEALARVVNLLDPEANPSARVHVIDGSGNGLTTLAIRGAHEVAGRYPRARLFLEMARAGAATLEPADALRRLLIMLGREESTIPRRVDDRADLFRRELPEGSLLVLDNVQSAEQVERLLPGRPGCAVLMTSSCSLMELEGVVEVPLDPMDEESAHALLEYRLGAERAAADPAAVREIVRLCGALPLALHMAAAQLATHANRQRSLASFAARLGDERARLDLLGSGHRGVRASFSLGYAALSPAAARLFRLLGVVKVPEFGPGLVRAIDGTEGAERAFEDLVNAYLIETPLDGRPRFHDLVRDFARERAEREQPAAEREAALDRALAWCVERATDLGGGMVVGRHRTADAGDRAHLDALDELETEREVMLAAIRQAAETGRGDVPWRITARLAGFFEIRGHWADWREAADLAVSCAPRLGDPEALGTAHYLRSWPLRLMRHTQQAIEDCVAALPPLARVPGARRTHADALSHLGTLYRETHRYDDAIRCLDEALDIYRRLDDRRGEGLALRTLGHVQFWRRDLDAARVTLERAILLLREAGDRANEGWAHNNLCSVHGAAWRYEDALAESATARAIFTELGDRLGAAWADNHIGRIHRQFGRIDDAIECNTRALEAFRAVADDYGIAWALLHLGAAGGRPEWIDEALAVFKGMSPPEDDGQGWALVWLARLRHTTEPIEQAIRHFAVVGNRQGEGTALSVRGDLERAAGRSDDAIGSYEKALAPLRRAGDVHGEALTLLGMSRLEDTAGHAESARELRESAMATLARLGAPEAAQESEG